MSSGTKPNPLSVFLVEDETLIQMMIADMIAELGHIVIAEASDFNQALSLAQTAHFDIAILDINLRGSELTRSLRLFRIASCPLSLLADMAREV